MPKMGDDEKTNETKLIEARQKWWDAREKSERYPTAASVTEAVKEILEIVREKPVSLEEAREIHAKGFGGAVIGDASERFADIFEMFDRHYPGLEQEQAKRKVKYWKKISEMGIAKKTKGPDSGASRKSSKRELESDATMISLEPPAGASEDETGPEGREKKTIPPVGRPKGAKRPTKRPPAEEANM
jgi:hypothetical protein